MIDPIYLQDCAVELGECTQSVEEAVASGQTLSSAAELRDAGFAAHRLCAPDTGAYDLARRAVSAIEDRLGGTSAIVYATTLPVNGSCKDAAAFDRSRDVKDLMDFPASHLQSDFGLADAFTVGVNQQACTGLLGSIRLARGLLLAEPELEKILCVTADRFPENALYEQAYSLISDGASGFLVSREARGYRVVACHAITNGAMVESSDDETVGCYFNYTHRLVTECMERAGLALEDIRWVVPQNTNRKAWEILGRLLEMDPERVFYDTLPDVGHVIGGDNIVNLKALEASGRMNTGDRVLLVMAGYGMSWQAVLLEVV